MSSQRNSPPLTLRQVKQFRASLYSSQEKFLSEESDPVRQMLLQLYYLTADIDDLLSSTFVGKQLKFQHTESQASTLKTTVGKSKFAETTSQQNTINDVKLITPVKSQKRRISGTGTPLDRLEGLDDYDDEGENRQAMSNTQRLQKQNKKLLNKLIEIEIKLQQVTKQKNYCLELLNKGTEKDSDLEIEIRCLKNQNKELASIIKQLQQQNRNLIECDEEKSVLLKDIDQFFTNNESKPGSKNLVISSRAANQNQKLIDEIVECQQQISRLNIELKILDDAHVRREQQLNALIITHEQSLCKLEDYQNQNSQLRLKNQQLINIEQSKKLNAIVHKQNKHLLQVNFQLGNKLYAYQQQIDKLIMRIIELEGDTPSRYGAQTPIHEQYGISTSPSANKGICIEEYQPISKTRSVAEIKHSSAQRTIHNLNLKLKNQTLINSELQNKIQELLDQLYTCEKSIFEKEKEIANMTLSFNRSATLQNIPTNNVIQSREKQLQQNSAVKISRTQKDEILTLEQFVEKFEPSLMDTLFIMLRITEIAIVMLQEGVKTMIPTQLLLQLDDPNKPQNIIVQLKSNENQEDTEAAYLFSSPETIEGGNVDEPAVVWNLGMMFYYLVCKEPYFKNVSEVLSNDELEFKKNIIPEAQSIIEGALRRQSDSRISIHQILEGISEEINKIFSEY